LHLCSSLVRCSIARSPTAIAAAPATAELPVERVEHSAGEWPGTPGAQAPTGPEVEGVGRRGRQTGNQLAANAGATTRELMHRMGHGSMRAALIYQHATTERDRRIAEALGALVDESRARARPAGQDDDEDDGGAAGALVPVA
jgi:hypothetical protein